MRSIHFWVKLEVLYFWLNNEIINKNITNCYGGGIRITQKFASWTKLKIRIHIIRQTVYFREKEIWWTSLGANIGREQDGKNEKFERPVLILKKFNKDLFWGMPLSSKVKDNQYYYRFENNGEIFSAITSQLKSLSGKRLLRKVAMFPGDDFIKIKEIIKKFL